MAKIISMFRRHPILTIVTLAYLGGVALVTLGPQPLGPGGQGLLYRVLDVFSAHTMTNWITYSTVEFGANVAMFAPIGLFFLLLFGRRQWWLAILVGFALTVGIETAQLSLPTRVSDIRDVISNTTGATLGVLAGLVLTADRARHTTRASRQTLAN